MRWASVREARRLSERRERDSSVDAGLAIYGKNAARECWACESLTGERVQVWALMEYRLTRLEQFSQELSARLR